MPGGSGFRLRRGFYLTPVGTQVRLCGSVVPYLEPAIWGLPFGAKRPMRLWLPSQEDSGDLSEYEACFCNSYTGHGDGDLSPWPVLLHRSYSSSKRRRPAISQTGREKTRDWAAVCMPAWVITAFMISRRSSAFTRINTSSRSAAMETPKELVGQVSAGTFRVDRGAASRARAAGRCHYLVHMALVRDDDQQLMCGFTLHSLWLLLPQQIIPCRGSANAGQRHCHQDAPARDIQPQFLFRLMHQLGERCAMHSSTDFPWPPSPDSPGFPSWLFRGPGQLKPGEVPAIDTRRQTLRHGSDLLW